MVFHAYTEIKKLKKRNQHPSRILKINVKLSLGDEHCLGNMK